MVRRWLTLVALLFLVSSCEASQAGYTTGELLVGAGSVTGVGWLSLLGAAVKRANTKCAQAEAKLNGPSRSQQATDDLRAENVVLRAELNAVRADVRVMQQALIARGLAVTLDGGS